MSETGLVKYDAGQIIESSAGFNLPDERTLVGKLNAISRFQQLVQQSLIEGVDYGVIPGTQKPCLYKPGAEKTAKLLELAEYYEIMTEIENWEKPFFYYKIKCILKLIGTDIVISQGMGSCNSLEDKYRYRWLWPAEVLVNMDKSKMVSRRTKKGGLQYRIENDEIYTVVNTLLKMAKKRAFIDAVLSAGRLSNLFTQDLEDMTINIETNAPQSTPNIQEAEVICPTHNVPMRQNKWGGYSHATDEKKNGKTVWCNWKLPDLEKALAQKDAKNTDIEGVDYGTGEILPSEDEALPEAPETQNNQQDELPTREALDAIAKQIWGGDWQGKYRTYLKSNYGYSSRKDIKEADLVPIFMKLNAILECK